VHQWVLLALYKNGCVCGWSSSPVQHGQGIKGGNCTLHHNTHILHHHFKAWGKSKTQLGNQAEWVCVWLVIISLLALSVTDGKFLKLQ
jgi:hypothetical protein